VVGSNIIKDAFIVNRIKPGGVNMAVDHMKVSVLWQKERCIVVKPKH